MAKLKRRNILCEYRGYRRTFEGDLRTLPAVKVPLAQFPAAASKVGASTNVQSFV